MAANSISFDDPTDPTSPSLGVIAMKFRFLILLLWPSALLAQSPFDGTWVANLESVQFSNRPEAYLLQNGMYACSSCVPNVRIKADGKDHPVSGSPYFSTLAVEVVDDHNVQITEKQGARVVYSEMDTVSPDGSTLTQKIVDSASASGQPVRAEEVYSRAEEGPGGSHAISGSWQVQQIKSASNNAITVTYHSTADGMQALNPKGEGYDAKFDMREYPIKGDPAHAMVCLKRINANTIVETDKQEGAPHYKVRMAVSTDGKSMKVEEWDLERGTKMAYTMEKKSQ
jgi:hypothetical protein